MVSHTGTLTYGRTWVPGGGPSWCGTSRSESEAEAKRGGGHAAQWKEGGGEKEAGQAYYRGLAVHSALTGRLAQRGGRWADNRKCSAISAEFVQVGGYQGEVHEIYSCRSCSPGCRRFVDEYRGVAVAASVASVVGLTAGCPP